jgi:hypothetical protein
LAVPGQIDRPARDVDGARLKVVDQVPVTLVGEQQAGPTSSPWVSACAIRWVSA